MKQSLLSNALLDLVEKGYTMSKEGILYNPSGKEVKGCDNGKGYLKIGYRYLIYPSLPISFHRIQGYLKFGNKIFEKGMMIRHLDNNSLNNHWDNIGIGTSQDNQLDIPLEKRRIMASSPKYNHQDIINDYKSGMSYKQLMEKYSISSKGTISHIVKKSLASEK